MFDQKPTIPLTPEQFIAQISATVIGGVKAMMDNKPVQEYSVLRQTPTGPATQKTSLPQMLAELTDTLKVNNDLMRYLIQLNQQVGSATESLRIELEENRKLAQKLTKRNRRKIEIEDEEEEE